MLDIAGGAAPDVLLRGLPEAIACDVSSDGQRLLQLRRSSYANLWRVGLTPRDAGPVALTKGTSLGVSPRLSPDGRWIAMSMLSRSGDYSRPMSGDTVVKVPITGAGDTAYERGVCILGARREQACLRLGSQRGLARVGR